MKLGDLVEKYRGYIPDVRVGIVTELARGPGDRVEVLCSDGYNRWIRKFVRVIGKNEVAEKTAGKNLPSNNDE